MRVETVSDECSLGALVLDDATELASENGSVSCSSLNSVESAKGDIVDVEAR